MFKSATNVADANVCMNYTWTNLNILLYELSIKLYIKRHTGGRKANWADLRHPKNQGGSEVWGGTANPLLHQPGGLGSVVSFTSEVWGRALAKIDFCIVLACKLVAGSHKFHFIQTGFESLSRRHIKPVSIGATGICRNTGYQI